MKTFSLVLCVLSLLCADAFGQGCAGSASCGARATPVRNLIAARPIRSGILQKISSVRASFGNASCGSAAQYSRVESAATPIVAPVRTALSNVYQQALASAQYRAANRIHGHSYLDTHRTSGVGWASSDGNPTTCLGRGGENYAVARGSDGWYATKFQ